MFSKAKLALAVSCFFSVSSLYCMHPTSMSEHEINEQTALSYKVYPDRINTPSNVFYDFSHNEQSYMANMRWGGRMVIGLSGQIFDQSSILYHADNIVSFVAEASLAGQFFAEKHAFFVFTHACSTDSLRIITVMFDRASQLFYVHIDEQKVVCVDSPGSFSFMSELTNNFHVITGSGTNSDVVVQIEHAADGHHASLFSIAQRPVFLIAQIDPKKACAKVQKNFIKDLSPAMRNYF